jgi:type 1 fimbria pilin
MRRTLVIKAIRHIAGIAILILFPFIKAMAVGEVNFTATLQPSTCDLSFKSGVTSGVGEQSGIMELNPVTVAELGRSSESSPVSGKALILSLKNCRGVGGLNQAPTVTISGDSDGTDGRPIFRSANSSSTGAGFVVFYDTANGPNGNQVNPAGTDWKLASTSNVPSDRDLPFWVGLTKIAGQNVTPGDITAAVRFEFAWK